MANVLGELFGSIADAIREKTGEEGTIKPARFPEKISGIGTGADVSAVTATASQVLEGAVFVDAQGDPVEGTMPDRTGYGKALFPAIPYTRIPEGYHDGTGMVQAVYQSYKTVTPTRQEQIVRGDTFEDDTGQARAKFLSYVTVRAIPDQYQDVTPVTAEAGDVRAGKVFVDAQGNVVTGTLEAQEKPADEIWVPIAGAGDSVGNALVGSGVIRYVTFCNHDGTVTYGQKSVLAGDNCADPVAGGYMDSPTRESDVQHTYTFSGGWATEPGGGRDSNALKNVTEDRTVYADFIAAVRYYTVSFYDGETLVHTEAVAYGGSSTYQHIKGDYIFQGWTPEPTNITGDLACYGSWIESVDFADASWETIISVSESGMASTVFSLGDQKQLTFTDPTGTEKTVTVQIVGFDQDEVYATGAKAGITVLATTPVCFTPLLDSSRVYSWSNCDLRSKLSTVTLPSFPEALRNGIKSVRKLTRKWVDGTATTGQDVTSDKVWIPSCGEFNVSTDYLGGSVYAEADGITYTYDYTNLLKNHNTWLRSGTYKNNYQAYARIAGTRWQTTNCVAGSYIVLGFCV